MRSMVGSFVGSTGDAVGAGTGDSVGAGIGDAVRAGTGNAVGAGMRKSTTAVGGIICFGPRAGLDRAETCWALSPEYKRTLGV